MQNNNIQSLICPLSRYVNVRVLYIHTCASLSLSLPLPISSFSITAAAITTVAGFDMSACFVEIETCR